MAKSVTRRGHKTSKRAQTSTVILNRRAGFDYNLSDSLTVGLELTGLEVKAARTNRVNLKGAYVTPKINPRTGKTELFLINASFTLNNNAPKGSGQPTTTVDTTARRILAHRREIDRFNEARQSGLTIVPTKLLTGGRYIKLVTMLGKGKKQYDKRESIKKRDTAREIKRLDKNFR